MVEEYVSKQEFNNLKDEVQEMKKEMSASNKLLSEIDKKIDVISEKITSGNKMDELKLQPLVKRVEILEDNHKYLSRTVAGTIIGIIIKVFFDISKMMT